MLVLSLICLLVSEPGSDFLIDGGGEVGCHVQVDFRKCLGSLKRLKE